MRCRNAIAFRISHRSKQTRGTEMQATLDTPVTNAELDQFYGSGLTDNELALEIGKAASDFEQDQLVDVVFTNYEQLAELIAAGNPVAIGNYLLYLRRQEIADTASRRIYGRAGVISHTEVTV